MKQLIVTTLLGLSIASSAVEISLLKPFTITAEESHSRVIEISTPRKAVLTIVFTGSDSAIEVHENATRIGTSKSIRHDGRTAIIDLNFSSTDVGKVFPVNIMTKEGKTHTIAIIPLSDGYKKEAIDIKIVITSTENLDK